MKHQHWNVFTVDKLPYRSTLLVCLLGLSSRMKFNYSELMLWCADTEKTQYSFVGKVGQGIYPQGSGKTHRLDDDQMRGLGTRRHTEGVPDACTAKGWGGEIVHM